MSKYFKKLSGNSGKIIDPLKAFPTIWRRVGLVIMVLVAFNNYFVEATTYYSISSNNWTNRNSWSTSSGGGRVGNGVYPVAGDNVIIEGGYTITVNIAGAACASVQLGSTNTTASGTLTFTSGSSLTVSGAILIGSNGNTGRTGTLTFVNTSSLTAGSITLGGPSGTPASGTITMTAGSVMTTGSLTIGAGSGTWTPSTGTVVLNGSNTLPTSIFTSFYNLTISSGTTTLGTAIPNVNGTLTVSAGATLALSTFNLGATSAPASTVLECGAPTGSSITGTGILSLGGNVTVNDIATGTGGASVSAPVALGATRTFAVADDGTAATDLIINGVISGAGFGVTKTGAGTLVLSASNTFTGAVTISAGILSANTIANAGAGNVSSLGTGAGAPTISIAGPGTLRYTGTGHSSSRTITLTGNGATIDASGSGTMTLSGGITGNTYGVILTGTGSGVESGIIGTTSGTVVKNGAGTWTLSGVNTFNGGTTLNTGILNINNANALGTVAGTFTINGGSIDNTSAGAITTLNYSQTWAGDFTFTGSNALNLGTGAITMSSSRQVTVSANTLTIGGAITAGTYNLTKAGTGTLTMGANSITLNGLIISAGTLTAPSVTMNLSGDFTNSGTFIHNNGTVNFNRAGAQVVAGVNYNNLTLSGSGTKTFSTGVVINGNLSITGALASLVAGITIPANTLMLNGIPQSSGTWGSTSSLAANQNNTYFAATTGMVNVSSSTCTAGTWLGTTNTDWNNTSNWCGGVPNSSTNVIIPSGGNQPTIGAAGGFCNNITINSGATLTMGGAYNLTVSGNWTNNGGTFTPATGTVTFNGSTPATIGGTSSTTFYNLIINNTAGVNIANNETVNGVLTLTAGIFAMTANTLTLNGPAIAGTPNNLNTTSSSTLVLGGSSTSIIVPSSVTSLSNLTISNPNGVALTGPLSSGTLTFTSGVLSTSLTNLLTITNTAAGSIGGVSATSYINGPLARTLLAGQVSYGTPYLFPVGDGADYRPLELLNITTGATTPVLLVSESGTGALAVDETTITGVAPRNWYVQTLNGNFTSAYVRLTENGLDFTKVIGQSPAQSGSYVSVGGTNIGTSITSASAIANASLPAYFAIGTSLVTTFYSYQSGDWNSSSTWTIDPSGSLWIAASVPGPADNVVILNGRTVTINQNSKNSLSLEIKLGGTLDLQATNSHNFGTVSGQGSLKLSSGTFPAGVFSSFVAADGGTVEYYNLNNAGISSTQLTYNNLIISNNTAGATTVFLNNASNPINYTLNGNFDLKNNGTGNLTFYFGNSTPSDNLINMVVNGNFTIGTSCNIRVNNFASSHTFPNPNNTTSTFPVHSLSVYGDFINNGTVRFTGLPSPFNNAYYTLGVTAFGGTNYGDVQVFFKGAADNTLTCNGITDFFRLIVQKGTDQTNKLEVISSSTNNFALYGPNNEGNNNAGGGSVGDYGYGVYYKALFINYGTLKLNVNINIASLTEGGEDFNLLPTAGLWINGANVSSTVTGLNGTGYQAATLYGALRISSGQFSTGDAAGLVLMQYGAPSILVESSGVLDVSQTWSATGATNIASYTQTGGTVNIRLQGEYHAGPQLGLSSTNSVFVMSGGTLNFTSNGGGTNYQLMNIAAQAGNHQVTGGTVNLNLPSSGTAYTAVSSVPFYDMNLTNQTGSGTVTVQWSAPSPLTILNDLTIGTNSVLDLNTNTINLYVGHNFTLNGTYTPGNNTTTFNGSGGQVFSNAGTITTGLNNFTLENSSNTNITNNLTLRGALTINSSCYLNDQGNTISVEGNITNSGIHTSQANGRIVLNGTGVQIIGGSGSGQFGNFAINKTAGSSTFSSNQSITGNLRLVSGILDINRYNLALSANSNIYDVLTGSPAPTTFGNTKMIITTGQQSDGGLTKSFNVTGSFLYPVGSGTAYHPATISISQTPATWGDITVKPVAAVHPLAIKGFEVMAYYWEVKSNLISGIQPGSVSNTFKYVAADVGAQINSYITGVFNPYTWIRGAVAQVDKINSNILFPDIDILDGDYTAGTPVGLGGVSVFYSHRSGDWDTPSTWSNVNNDPGSPDAVTIPGPDNAVVIGDKLTNNHVVTISTNGKSCGMLEIDSGSALDLKTTTGHNFEVLIEKQIRGAGTLRIASGIFPDGDFGEFLGLNGGTVEYYTETTPSDIGAAFTLPATYLNDSKLINITNYCNLILSPASGKNITLPNTDLTIYKDFKVSVSGTSATGITQLNNQNTSHTVTIIGNLFVNNGNLQFTNGGSTSQNVVVYGDVSIASGAIFDVAASLAATNTLSIQGDLTNNGIFDMIAGGSQICNVTFTGSDNKQIKGTTAVRTDFNILTVNKGINRNSILEATVNAFSLNTSLATALTINSGTFRLSSPLTITLTTSSPFTIPISGCLSANIGTINIGAANNNAADLILQGRLEVMNTGIVNTGNGSGSNNDIEYAAAGNPEINISGGSLNVDGQIRRNTANTLGSLWFSQSGGTITVKGNSLNTSRGVFEIVNSGSTINLSGGNLIIEKAGSTTYADILITPQSSTVNNSNGGHTLIIGDAATPASQVFSLNTSAPLWNLTVDGTTQNKTANLTVNTLSVLNNLTINGNGVAGTGSVFKANELNVTIGGSLTNNNLSATVGAGHGGYQAGADGSAQTTTLTGTGALTGTGSNLTNFADLVIGSASTTPAIVLGLNSNIMVNNDLILAAGTLSDAGNTITVMGDIDNSAIHSSPSSPGGGIVLASGIKQTISGNGNGSFGNITINNPTRVSMVDDIRVTGQLNLALGSLYIDDYKLIMDIDASFNGPFDHKHMIASNGVLSDRGVQKYFSGSATGFILPIGSNDKYCPATFTFVSSNEGSINVVPVALQHPVDNAPTSDQLNYYWKVLTTGFSGLTSSAQVYQYDHSFVKGNESNYHGAFYRNFTWTDYGTSVINTSTHTITINRSDLLAGEYTAGEIANFTDVHTLYSLKSGNWNDGTAWAEDLPTNPPCGYFPNGNPVFIQSGHTITMNINNAFSYSVNIEGILDLGVTSFHDLGYIIDTLHAGTGKMMIQATSAGMYLFPGANYDSFMASPGTTVELYGTTNASLPLKPGNIYKPYQNLILTGSGIKYMSAEDLKILGNLTINDLALLNNALYNKHLYILGNWTDLNATSAGFVPGNGVVSFEGNSAQTLTITNAGITENYYDFQINNSSGLTLAGGGNIKVTDMLYLINGTITTNTNNSLTLTNSSTSAVVGGSVNSFINGPLRKQISDGSYFTFPVGKTGTPSRYGNVYLSNIVNSGIWEAEYYNSPPPYDITSKKLPISHVSNNEYWRINGVAGGSGNVQLRWDASSGYAGSSLATRSKIRIVEWNPSGAPFAQWEYRGKILNDGGDTYGTVTTDNIISLAPGTDLHYCTIGDEGLPTATITSPLSASICNDAVASATVTVALTGTPPWSVTYNLGTASTTINNIGSTPLSIVLTSASPGITQPIVNPTIFNFNITDVNDLTGTPGTTDFLTTVAVTVNPIPSNTITGKTSVGTGEVVVYSTPADASTYAWTLSANGTPLTGNAATYTVTWGVATPGPYTISLTKTAVNGCQATNSISVTTSTTPTPVITGNQYVCAGSTGQVYSTPNVAGHDYTWTINPGTAGTITSGGNSNSCTITWNGAATGNSVNVREHVTASGSPGIFTDATLPVDIGLQPSAVAPSYTAPASVCTGSAAAVIINNSENGVRYQIRLNSDNSNVGAAVNGNGGAITLNTTAITSSTTYNIYAYTQAPFNCGIQLNNPALSFTINIGDLVWTGSLSTDWNVPGNWSCGFIPGPTTIVQIPNVANKPVLSSGTIANVNNLTINAGSSLTISGNTIQIAGTITNSGTFTATAGTISMNGSAAQTIAANVFSGNTIKDLIINNPAGVTLQGPLNITGVVTAQNGDLSSGGNLTLISSAAQTALISGSGTGTVAGNVTMQRYLPSGFGYKYFSSPFQSATVNDFADDITLGAYTFYKYDESRTSSGWVNYDSPLTNPLVPIQGYTVNFGDVDAPNTVDITGVVNNGSLSVTLYNNNNLYTAGFNLVGNPYPSPIDWNAAGWTKNNIDNALYYFKASTIDQYGGTYSSWIGGVSNDGSTNMNIIPSMQGFFIHVSNGAFPVTGTLGMNNSVRITDLNHSFTKSLNISSSPPLLRLSAEFSDDQASADRAVIYFDEKATPDFDSQLDALKLLNTDWAVSNLYTVNPDGTKLSISALPPVSDNLLQIPLGLKLNREGSIIFRISDIDESLTGFRIYITDIAAGIDQDLLPDKKYTVSLGTGEYDNRFFLNLSNIETGITDDTSPKDLFSIYSAHGKLNAEINILEGGKGTLKIYNLLGQLIFNENIYEKGPHEFSPGLKEGIYLISYTTGIKISSKKLFIQSR